MLRRKSPPDRMGVDWLVERAWQMALLTPILRKAYCIIRTEAANTPARFTKTIWLLFNVLLAWVVQVIVTIMLSWRVSLPLSRPNAQLRSSKARLRLIRPSLNSLRAGTIAKGCIHPWTISAQWNSSYPQDIRRRWDRPRFLVGKEDNGQVLLCYTIMLLLLIPQPGHFTKDSLPILPLRVSLLLGILLTTINQPRKCRWRWFQTAQKPTWRMRIRWTTQVN